jgi:xylan 1,4-beta-xylosidase
VTLLIAGVLVSQNKYRVKKFIKANSFLYAPAKKLAEIKHRLTNSTAQKPEQEKQEAKGPARGGVTDWSLVFDAGQSAGQLDRCWGNLGYESFKGGIFSGKSSRLFELMKETNARTNGAFQYIRAHNLFSDGQPPYGEGLGIYREDKNGRPIYDWTMADQVFDHIVQNGLKPIIEFGFMPDALASLPARRQKWGKANISPPADYRKWEALVYETVSHFCKRYGDAEVGSWYFEVWNEPDLGYLFWVEDSTHKPFGDMPEYFRLYDYAVRGAKRAFPQIKVGGPASAGGQISQHLEHVLLERNHATDEKGAPIDFVSTHAYGKVGDALSQRNDGSVMGAILWKMARAADHDHPKVREAIRKLPFLLTETGPTTRNGLLYNTRYVAAWMVKMVDAVVFLGEQHGKVYQPVELVFWSSDQFGKEFGKEKGIATYFKNGTDLTVIKRPVYNAFEILGHLSNDRIAQIGGLRFGDPVHGLATRTGSKSVEIVLYHLDESDQENRAQDSIEVALEVARLPFESFEVQWYAVDETHSNGYALWEKRGRPKTLSAGVARELSKRDDLEMVKPAWREKTADGRFRMNVTLQRNSVALFVLSSTDRGRRESNMQEAF